MCIRTDYVHDTVSLTLTHKTMAPGSSHMHTQYTILNVTYVGTLIKKYVIPVEIIRERRRRTMHRSTRKTSMFIQYDMYSRSTRSM